MAVQKARPSVKQKLNKQITFKSVAIDAGIIFTVATSIILFLVYVPNEALLSAFTRIESVITIILATSVICTLLLQAIRKEYHLVALEKLKNMCRIIGINGALITCLYISGLVICERLGWSPPLENWLEFDWSFITFFTIYNTIFLLCWLLKKSIDKAVEEAKSDPIDWKSVKSILNKIKPIALILAVPVYIAGLVALEWLGMGPSLSVANLGSRNAIQFLSIYTLIFLSIPLIIAVVSSLVFSLGLMLIALAKIIFSSERWRRFVGAKLSPEELDARLQTERAARDELVDEWRIQKSAEHKLSLQQRQDELKEFGPITARFLWWSPVVTLGAQTASFVTSYLGVKIYLNLRQANVEWLGIDIPSSILNLIGAPDTTRLSLMSNDLMAIASSIFMALIIWGLSTLAIGRVRKLQSVPITVFFFIIGLGLASTYTAFIFWNGEVATSEQLNIAHRENVAFLASVKSVDEKNLIAAKQDIENMKTQTSDVLLQAKIDVLRGHLYELQLVQDSLSQAFSAASDIGYCLESGKDFYTTFADCESASGCLSNLRGEGEVVKSLMQNVEAFDNNLKIWEKISNQQKMYSEEARKSALEAVNQLQIRDLSKAQQEVSNMRAAVIGMQSEQPSIIFRAIESRLSIPIESQAPTESQRAALINLQEGIQTHIQELQGIEEKASIEALDLPVEIRLDSVGLKLSQDLGLLNQISKEMEQLVGERQERVALTEHELLELKSRVDVLGEEKLLITNSPNLYLKINENRDLINGLSNIDPSPILSKLDFLVSDFNQKNKSSISRGSGLISYPVRTEYEPDTIALSILKHADLSVVPLLIQIMLDFGYTLVIVLVATRLRKQSA